MKKLSKVAHMWLQWWTGRDRSLRLTAFGEFKASKRLSKTKKGGMVSKIAQ